MTNRARPVYVLELAVEGRTSECRIFDYTRNFGTLPCQPMVGWHVKFPKTPLAENQPLMTVVRAVILEAGRDDMTVVLGVLAPSDEAMAKVAKALRKSGEWKEQR